MKLLLDQNLSHRLINSLIDLFPDSVHVKDFQLANCSDSEIWEFSKTNGYTIVSKDADFHQRSFVYGAPPKVIWIQKGNCPTDEILEILRIHAHQIKVFIQDKESTFLAID